MPWTPRDARRHKHGLSARQARQWSRVANSILRTCLREGGTQSACEGRAIRGANSAVGEPVQATNQRRVTINTALTVPPVRMVLNSQEYLTAPVVMVVEGVLNGGLIPIEELHPQEWQGVHVTIGHPLNAEGAPHSARQPAVLASCGVGQVFHVRQGTGRRRGHAVASLQGELWLNLADVARCGAEAQQAVDMLESQTPLECSTAFFSDAERTTGSFYGTPYTEIHRNLRPDHLALLPNDIGACDWAAGCGAPRLNAQTLTYTSTKPEGCACAGTACTCQEGDLSMTLTELQPRGWRAFVQMLKQFVQHEEARPDPPPDEEESEDESPLIGTEEDEGENEEEDEEEDEEPITSALATHVTDVDIREALYGELAREMGQDITPIFIDSLDPEARTFTYRMGERLCQRTWSLVDGRVMLASGSTDVQRSTTYVPVPDSPDGPQPGRNPQTYAQEMVPMPPTAAVKKLVDELVTNERTQWTELHRSRLEAMDEAMLMLMQQELRPPRADGPRPLHEILASVEPNQREALEEAFQTYNVRKDQLVELILSNKDNDFSRDELVAMQAKRLEKIVRMSGDLLPGEKPERYGANYVGRRMPHIRVVTEEEDVPAPPKTMELVVQRQKELGLRV